MLRRLFVIVFCLPGLGLAAGIQWQAWSPEMFTRAAREDRLVLVDVTAQWCAFCKKMDLETYTDPEVVALIRARYVPVRMDEAAFPEWVARYPARRPLTLVFDAQGRERVRKAGYLKPRWMLWLLQAMLEEARP